MLLPAPVSVRLNPAKRIDDFNNFEHVPWASDAFYLPERISFTLDPLFHAGCYYVQEASSMYLETVLRGLTTNQPVKVLDLCAAPGGKTSHMLGTLPPGSLVVSNEVVSSRNVILQQNLSRWGFAEAVVTQNDAADFEVLKNYFDIILVDAPCSGEGLFRKQPEATSEWSEAAVDHCSVRQQQLLENILPALKSGGFLVYSTCTFEPDENENQVRWLEENFSMKPIRQENTAPGIINSEYGLLFYPHRVRGEGFFISVMQKITDQEFSSGRKRTEVKKDSFIMNSLLDHTENFRCYRKQNELYAFPASLWNDMHLLMEHLFVRKAGLHLGTMKGNDLVPSHELALAKDLHPMVPRTLLTKEEALRFLKCENIVPSGVSQGWSVASYRNFPLGWMKGIGKRVNNYYPRSQRILMSL